MTTRILVFASCVCRARSVRRCAVLAASFRRPALSLEMGCGRPARVGQSHEARQRAARGQAHSHRRSARAGACAQDRHAVLGRPAVRDARQAHEHEHRLQPAREQRRDHVHRDGPGGHAVRRLHTPDDRRQPLQLREAGRRRDARRVHEAGHREGRLAHDARRAHRRGGAEGCRDAARHLSHHR